MFHNTYTYNGQRKSVRRWAVKIQFQGRRRTFSLLGRTRTEAAAEAQSLYETLRLEGWEAMLQVAARGSLSKNDIRYWRRRLRLRKYGAGGEVHYSARIDHEGRSAYFPVGHRDPEQAAAQALQIYRHLVKAGWERVRPCFAYEVTLGFHWAADPLLWSYTTLHTMLEPPAPADASGERGLALDESRRPGRIVVIEPSAEIRNAWLWCLAKEAGMECVAFESWEGWEAGKDSSPAWLCLVNLECAEPLLAGEAVQLAALGNGVCAVPYSIHVDSDDLFLAAPGGLSGYCFKRLSPKEVLRPVLSVLSDAVSPGTLMHAVQSFFQGATQIPSRMPAASSQQAPFTRREQEVLALLSKGYVDKEIARALGISTWTVHEHVKRVFEKLGVHSRIEATLAYLQK